MSAARCVWLAAALWLAAPSFGAEPDTRQMIEALSPTRATRNLVVRLRPAEGAASSAEAATPESAPPNLSLAVQFERNSARVSAQSGPVLGSLVAAMLSPELMGRRFLIEGHTDARGDPTLNLRLSQQRAEEVRMYLTTLGVSPARLRAVGKGAREPANAQDPLAAENRRVRVVTVE